MAKQYLRVATSWSQLAAPRNEVMYLLNVSGTAVQVCLSDTEITDFTKIKYPFAVGGLISQIQVAKTQYVYAKACSEDDLQEAVLITDGMHIETADTDNFRSDIDDLSVQVMYLTQRVTDTELDAVHRLIDYTLLLREFCDNTLKTNNLVMNVQNQVLKLNKRLFAAEQFIQEYRNKFNTLLYRIDEIEASTSASAAITSMQIAVTNVVNSINNINSKLNAIATKVDAAYADYSTMIAENITPIHDSVTELHADFASLNNALVRLSTENTAAQIETEFNNIILSVSEDMREPVTALKDILVELALISAKNEAQDDALASTVSMGDTIILDATSSALEQLIVG